MNDIIQLYETEEEENKRYSVEKAIIETKSGEREAFLVLYDDVPVTDINKHLIIKQFKHARPCSTGAYVLAKMLNYMADLGLEINEITRGHIYDYLLELYVEDGKKYKTIISYITIISDLFEDLFKHNIPIHPSLYKEKDALFVIKNAKDRRRLTTIPLMKKEFVPNKYAALNSGMISYTKWYTSEQIDALAKELPLVYRCIFLDTVMTGHRVDSALSVTLDTVNTKEHYIMPTRTKTGRNHKAYLPKTVEDLIYTYQMEDRTAIEAKTGTSSNYLFLGRNGQPVTYGAYYKALKAAADRVRRKHPELGLSDVHTHAGRSTFAAALRSYQKALEKKGDHSITDDDFCKLMDWSSLQCLDNYDILTRTQMLSPLIETFSDEFFSFTNPKTINSLEEMNARS